MKKLIVLIALCLAVATSHAYTPLIYINGQTHNAGLPYGQSSFNDYIEEKGELAPSLIFNATSLFVQPSGSDTEYNAGIFAFTYHQNLDGLLKGLSFQFFLPVTVTAAHIKNRIVLETGLGFKQFENLRLTKSGIADIYLIADYRLWNTESYKSATHLDVILPTGNKQSHPFIPVIGNGEHIALGTGIDGSARLVGNEDHNLTATSDIQYHHLFGVKNSRILGIEKNTPGSININPNGSINITPDITATIGSANVSSCNDIDIASGLTYNYHAFFLDAGTRYHCTSEQNISASNNFFAPSNNFNYFSLNGTTVDLQKVSANGNTATVPTSHVLKIYTDIGLTEKEWAYPYLNWDCSLYFSLGTTFTVVNKNSPKLWDFHVKSGLCF